MKNEEMFNSCAHEVEVESLAMGTTDINSCTSKVLFEKSLTPDPIKFLHSLIQSFMNHADMKQTLPNYQIMNFQLTVKKK